MPRYSRNYERNGIEIYFEKKPSEAVRDALKVNGWRWSSYNKYWYNYYSDMNLRFAEELCGGNNKGMFQEDSITKKETPKVTNTPAKVQTTHSPAFKKPLFSPNDKVLVSFEDGKNMLDL